MKSMLLYNTLLYNIFKYDRHPVTFELYLLLNTSGQQCATEMKCISKSICLPKLIHKLLFL